MNDRGKKFILLQRTSFNCYVEYRNECIVHAFRQYFENCSIHSCFIGYSSETTALVVKKSTDELYGKVELQMLWSEVGTFSFVFSLKTVPINVY